MRAESRVCVDGGGRRKLGHGDEGVSGYGACSSSLASWQPGGARRRRLRFFCFVATISSVFGNAGLCLVVPEVLPSEGFITWLLEDALRILPNGWNYKYSSLLIAEGVTAFCCRWSLHHGVKDHYRNSINR